MEVSNAVLSDITPHQSVPCHLVTLSPCHLQYWNTLSLNQFIIVIGFIRLKWICRTKFVGWTLSPWMYCAYLSITIRNELIHNSYAFFTALYNNSKSFVKHRSWNWIRKKQILQLRNQICYFNKHSGAMVGVKLESRLVW